MRQRLKYHFEPGKGWMNDPNGLIFYKGYYHAFFQHNPKAPKWDTMHWGHAISKDMLHWEEQKIALYPDMPYENDGGCFSGSAIEKDGRLYLFYTSVSHELGQTQSVAYSDDGINFTKYENNPVIDHYPIDGCKDFRDPKVIKYQDKYLMVVGSKGKQFGRVLLYYSDDLLNWEYSGVLFEDTAYTDTIECPDLFFLDDKYVLMYSKIGCSMSATQFVIGTFDGQIFYEEYRVSPEMGPQFYAPQTFMAEDGRRIMIGWFYDWKLKPGKDDIYAGALSLPRELELSGDHILAKPIREADGLRVSEDENVTVLPDIDSGKKVIVTGTTEGDIEYCCNLHNIWIYRDGIGLEVFINNGECVISARMIDNGE